MDRRKLQKALQDERCGQGWCDYHGSDSPEVIDRKSEEVGLSPAEFIRGFEVVAHFDNFDGVFYTFEEVTGAKE